MTNKELDVSKMSVAYKINELLALFEEHSRGYEIYEVEYEFANLKAYTISTRDNISFNVTDETKTLIDLSRTELIILLTKLSDANEYVRFLKGKNYE